jgi:hypothetical protein
MKVGQIQNTTRTTSLKVEMASIGVKKYVLTELLNKSKYMSKAEVRSHRKAQATRKVVGCQNS